MRGSLTERLWAKVRKGPACWVWTGTVNNHGYGQIGVGPHKLAFVHRVSWELAYGPIPDGLYVLHDCDNPPCVRPDHLRLGDQARNMADAAQRGRMPKGRDHWTARMPERIPHHEGKPGEANPAAKLTLAQVEMIRRRHTDGSSQLGLAKEYGMSQAQIWAIVHYKSWA